MVALKMPAALVVALVTAPAAALAGEAHLVLPADNETKNGNSSTTFPFASSSTSERVQWAYDPSLFGATGPILITEISVRANQNNLGLDPFCFPSMEVSLSSGAAPVSQLTGNFEANLGFDVTTVRHAFAFAGGPVTPTTSPPFVAKWVPLGLTQPFPFDPSTAPSFVVDVKVCAQTTKWSQGMDGVATSSSLGKTFATTSSCQSTTGGATLSGFIPVIRIDYETAPVAEWQTNSCDAFFTVEAGSNSPFSPIRVKKAVGDTISFRFASDLVGSVYAIAIAPAPAVGGLSGGIQTGGGQFINVPFAASPTFVVGTVLTEDVQILQFPVPVPIPPATLQMFVVDHSHPDDFQVSAAVEVTVEPGC